MSEHKEDDKYKFVQNIEEQDDKILAGAWQLDGDGLSGPDFTQRFSHWFGSSKNLGLLSFPLHAIERGKGLGGSTESDIRPAPSHGESVGSTSAQYAVDPLRPPSPADTLLGGLMASHNFAHPHSDDKRPNSRPKTNRRFTASTNTRNFVASNP